jgi:hypothetical protein
MIGAYVLIRAAVGSSAGGGQGGLRDGWALGRMASHTGRKAPHVAQEHRAFAWSVS